jgi:hypothetical protein
MGGMDMRYFSATDAEVHSTSQSHVDLGKFWVNLLHWASRGHACNSHRVADLLTTTLFPRVVDA